MTLNSNSSIELWEDAAASQPQLYSPLTLAFLGDGVFELLAREQIVKKGSMPVAKLHLKAVELVRADAQAALYEALLPLLSQEELEVLRRGRNANGVRPPKNADPIAYRKATGVEALFGYLYLCRRSQRLHELFQVALTLQAEQADERMPQVSSFNRETKKH